MTAITGLVLAAGAGRRFGGPKALARDPAGRPWLHLAVAALQNGGCDEVIVVVGAGADAAAPLVPDGARTIVAADWAGGLSASLRAGLAAAAGADACIVVPVDTPELPAAAVARILASVVEPRRALARATFDGRPGHPVLLGADHWKDLLSGISGDIGAGPYLARRGAVEVECGDLWSGRDHDTPSPEPRPQHPFILDR